MTTVGRFVKQKSVDFNTSLVAIGLLMSVADFIKCLPKYNFIL